LWRFFDIESGERDLKPREGVRRQVKGGRKYAGREAMNAEGLE